MDAYSFISVFPRAVMSLLFGRIEMLSSFDPLGEASTNFPHRLASQIGKHYCTHIFKPMGNIFFSL